MKNEAVSAVPIDMQEILGNRNYIDSHPAPVTPESTLYINRYSAVLNDQKTVELSGIHLVFQRGNKNNLFETYNTDRTMEITDPDTPVHLKSLRIACDTLTIFGELALPECDVSIYARKLVFKENGCINTSPLLWSPALRLGKNAAETGSNGTNGIPGRKAGNISVFLSEPLESSNAKLFKAAGGAGTDAGLGMAGENGKDVPSAGSVNVSFDGVPPCSIVIPLDPPATYFYGEWYDSWLGHRPIMQNTNTWGSVSEVPGNGTDARPGGISGAGGAGGDFESNLEEAGAWIDNGGGAAGRPAAPVKGGKAGKPVLSGKYNKKLWYSNGNYGHSGKVEDLHLPMFHQSKPGLDWVPSQISANGTPGKTTLTPGANRWLHPLQLGAVLNYARDAFLSAQRDEVSALLNVYSTALSLNPPVENSIWNESNISQWRSAQAEVASILQRLRQNLDFFGNPAGYIPLLSLKGNMQLYAAESRSALRAILLEKWVTGVSAQKESAAEAFAETITELCADSATVGGNVVSQKHTITKVTEKIQSVEKTLKDLQVKINILQERLEREAEHELEQKALVKFLAKTAGAILQVIPAGQPALGAVGSLAGIIADSADNGVPRTLKSIGSVLGDAKYAAGKAKDAADKANAGDEERAGWPSAGQMGSAVSQVGDAISALNVPQKDIDAELARLTAQSHEWQELAKEIKEFNAQKSVLFTDLMTALQAVNDGYARLSANSISIEMLKQQQGRTLEQMAPAATQVVRDIGQRARTSLIYSLYLMVKSYETTVFRPLDVDWRFTSVFEKITTLLSSTEGLHAGNIIDPEYTEMLAVIFKENLNAVRRRLLSDYAAQSINMQEVELEFDFTENENSSILSELNDNGTVDFSSMILNLIPSNVQKVRVVDFDITAIEIDENKQTAGNAVISLHVGKDGTIRSEQDLFVVRSDVSRVWTWTYSFSSNKTLKAKPAMDSLMLFNEILEMDDNVSLKQRQIISSPPFWSEMCLKLQFAPPLEPRPPVTKLMFKAIVDWVPYTDNRRNVLSGHE